MKRVLLALALGICISACGPSPTDAIASFVPAPLVTYTLSGVVSEMKTTGLVPVEGVTVNAQIHAPAITDVNGSYTLSGLSASGLAAFPITVTLRKPSYEVGTSLGGHLKTGH